MADLDASTIRSSIAGASTFVLPPLPYGIDALLPVLSAETLTVHHGKHHARYVETLNRLLAERNETASTLESVIHAAQANGTQGLFNNPAQAWNHGFFWESMAPAPVKPSNALTAAIKASFGGLDALGTRFIAEAPAISRPAGSGSWRGATGLRSSQPMMPDVLFWMTVSPRFCAATCGSMPITSIIGRIAPSG